MKDTFRRFLPGIVRHRFIAAERITGTRVLHVQNDTSDLITQARQL